MINIVESALNDRRRRCWTACAATVLATMVVSPAMAQHAADVTFEVVNNRLEVTSGNLYSAVLIGAGFPPMPSPPPTQTDSPGFFAADGALPAGATVGLRVVQPLYYWNPATGNVENPSPLDTILRLETFGGATVDVTRSGAPNPDAMNFAVASAEGGVHQHFLYRLPETTAPSGVYGVVLTLTSPGLEDSAPFVAAFSQLTTAPQLVAGREKILAASGIGAGSLQADFNLDGSVDGGDLALWRTGFGKSSHALLGDGDANRDGRVDGGDFLAWQRELGSTSPLPGSSSSAPSAAVPEAESLALAIGALVFLVGVVRGSAASLLRRPTSA
jgi:hypothetical protein